MEQNTTGKKNGAYLNHINIVHRSINPDAFVCTFMLKRIDIRKGHIMCMKHKISLSLYNV